MSQYRALLLVGSPRGKHSTSAALGSYLLERLAAAAVDTTMLRIASAEQGQQHGKINTAVDGIDLLLLSFPLYMDSLPAGLLLVLEDLAKHCQQRPGRRRQRLAVLVNSGFPEAEQAATALDICRQFAREAGFEWAGGLSLGGGAVINGRPLRQAGRLGRQIMLSLDLAAAALAAGEEIPATAVARMGALLLPKNLYVWFGTIDFKIKARADGAHKRLYDQPYRCATRQ